MPDPSVSIQRRAPARTALATFALSIAALGSAVGLAPAAFADDSEAPPEGDSGSDPSIPIDDEVTAPAASVEESQPPAGTEPELPAVASEPGAAETVPDGLAEAQPPAAAPDVVALGPIEGDFGTGKLRVSVLPDGGSYPRDPADPMQPDPSLDLSDAEIEVVDVTDPANPVPLGTCVTLPESFFGPSGSCFPFAFPIQLGHSYVVTQLSAPAGFLVDPDSPVSFTADNPECGGPVDTVTDGDVGLLAVAEGCNNIIFEMPGVFRTLGVGKTSTVDGTPLAGATYVLCAPVQPPPPVPTFTAVPPTPGGPSAAGCPEGSENVAESTTGPDGVAIFEAGPFLPGEGYAVYETVAPAGYLIDPNLQTFVVPEAASTAEALDPVLVTVTDAADVPPPAAVADRATVAANGSVVIRILTNDAGNGAPIFLTAVTAPAHGSAVIVEDPSCAGAPSCTLVILYTPTAGYAGPDTFQYTIRSRGGASTATVSVDVRPAAGVGTRPLSLPATGADVAGLATGGGGLLAVGGLLVAGSLNRDRRRVLATTAGARS